MKKRRHKKNPGSGGGVLSLRHPVTYATRGVPYLVKEGFPLALGFTASYVGRKAFSKYVTDKFDTGLASYAVGLGIPGVIALLVGLGGKRLGGHKMALKMAIGAGAAELLRFNQEYIWPKITPHLPAFMQGLRGGSQAQFDDSFLADTTIQSEPPRGLGEMIFTDNRPQRLVMNRPHPHQHMGRLGTYITTGAMMDGLHEFLSPEMAGGTDYPGSTTAAPVIQGID